MAPLVTVLLCLGLGARVRARPHPDAVARPHRRDPASPSVTVAVVLVGFLAFVVVAGGVALVVAGLAGGGAAGLRWARGLRSQVHARRARAAALPDLVDLCRVAASAGTSAWAVLEAVAPRAPAPCRPAFHELLARRDRGEPLAAGLQGLAAALGPGASALTDALARSAATGMPLAPLLADVAAATHDQRRRQAQEAARRLPVTLLFPLALCVLPAAVALAVVPVLVVSLHALSS